MFDQSKRTFTPIRRWCQTIGVQFKIGMGIRVSYPEEVKLKAYRNAASACSCKNQLSMSTQPYSIIDSQNCKNQSNNEKRPPKGSLQLEKDRTHQ